MSSPVKSNPGEIKDRRESLLIPDSNGKTGIVFFSISMVLHGLFFLGMFFFPDFKSSTPLPPVVQIDLVSFSPEPVFDEPAKMQPSSPENGVPAKTPPAVKKKSLKIPNLKPDISLKAKPKNLKEVIARQEKKNNPPDAKKESKPVEKNQSKEAVDPEEVLEAVRKQLEKKVEDRNQDRLSQALSRLQKKVEEQDDGKENQGSGAYPGYGRKGYKPIELYKMVLGSKIEQNWVFNETLASMNQNLEVRILIKVLKTGEIRDIIYETRSGNRYLDESAKKAIKKANPLPPLPAGRHSYDVIVIFTPRGLK